MDQIIWNKIYREHKQKSFVLKEQNQENIYVARKQLRIIMSQGDKVLGTKYITHSKGNI